MAGPRPKRRMTVYLLVTEGCNLGCVYCLNGKGTYLRSGPSAMTPELAIQNVTACLEEIVAGGTVEVAFFGGEPLLQWPLIKEIIKRCEEELRPRYGDKKIAYHLTSNLTLCPPDLVEVVGRHKITVMCDVDGPPEIHDRCRPYLHGGPSHARTAETIRWLTEAGNAVSLRATIISINQDCLLDVSAHHKFLGAGNSAMVPACPINSDRDFMADELLADPDKVIAGSLEVFRSRLWDRQSLFPFNQYISKIRPGTRQVVACAAPAGTTPVVRVNGDVYLCIYLVGQEKYRYGTASQPWDRRLLSDTMTTLHVDNLEQCRECPWRYACGGGCPLLRLARLDGVERSPKVAEYGRRIACDFTQAVLTELLWDVAGQVRQSVAQGRQMADPAAPEDTHFC
jgi:uncharacterized protein